MKQLGLKSAEAATVPQLLRTRGVSRWVSQEQNRGLLGTAIQALAWNSASFPGDSSGSVGTIPAADRQLLTGWLAIRLPLILPETVPPGTEASVQRPSPCTRKGPPHFSSRA